MNSHATLLICDDVRAEINGKLFVIGIYTNDIAIPEVPSVASQLCFLFVVEVAMASRPKKIVLEVTLPDQVPVQLALPLGTLPPQMEGRSRFLYRQVLTIQNALLMPGRIKARVILDDSEELPASASWIAHVPVIAPPPIEQKPAGTPE